MYTSTYICSGKIRYSKTTATGSNRICSSGYNKEKGSTAKCKQLNQMLFTELQLAICYFCEQDLGTCHL